MTLGSSSVIGFIATLDLARSREFYENTLGLPVVEESEFALVFDANSTMIRLTPAGEVFVAPYTILGWDVADIAAVVDELTARGVSFTRYDGMGQGPTGIWNSPSGAQVAWFVDPDGHTLSLTQFH